MTIIHRCRYCHQPLTIPQWFGPARQRIFEFIWNNPGCDVKRIKTEVYGRKVRTNAVSVHIANIRDALMPTEYRLETVGTQFGFRQYSIKPSVRIEKTAEPPTEGTSNVTI